MKKIVFSITLLFFSIIGFSQQIPSNVISITQSGNSLIISFNLPNYTVNDTSLIASYGVSELFKHIDLDGDYFGNIDDIGYPQLPQLTFDLSIPDGAYNFQTNTSNAITQNLYINRRFLPAQEDYDYETNPAFQINSSYYSSSGSSFNFLSQISEPYIVFGETGISFSIFPFTYNPQSNKITVLKQATFTINYSVSIQKSSQVDYNSPIKDAYLSSFFENYVYTKSGSNFSGRYLMITTPTYEPTLTYFANYKRNIGYEVTVVNTSTTGTTTTDIKNYIQSQYNNSSTRPDFVLLVGDHGDIPASAGNSAGTDIDDPITDLNYAKLEGDDYFADVFLGRFSVSSTAELQNIINKTIYMEMNIHLLDKKAKFLAGEESNGWMENQFENGHDKVIKKTFDPEGYSSQKLYQPNIADAIAALNDNPLFYLYSGHGSFTYMAGGSFSLYDTDLTSASNTVFPFVFSFACKTGNFAYSSTCIGEHWIRTQNLGGVTYFGSSVSTMVNSDEAIEKKIFGDAFTENEHIAAITSLGMKAYWKRFWSFWNRKRTKRYMKAYNLLGDPSLNILGTGCISNFVFTNNEIFNSGDVISYHASNDIENSNDFEVKSGANVTLLAGNSITLNPGFKVEAGAVFKADIQPCDNGTTLKSATIQSTEVINVEQKINSQIINPEKFSLFPNPTNSDFSVSYTIEKASFVKIEIYDITGSKVKTILDINNQVAGNHYQNFSISELKSGTYIFVLTHKSGKITNKIIKN